MKRYDFSGCSHPGCLCYSSVDEAADGDYIKFSDLLVFQTWLEQQIVDATATAGRRAQSNRFGTLEEVMKKFKEVNNG